MKKFRLVLLTVVLLLTCCGVSRSPLLEGEDIPRPCKYMIEYWYSSQKGEKALSGSLMGWCKKVENHTACKKISADVYSKAYLDCIKSRN